MILLVHVLLLFSVHLSAYWMAEVATFAPITLPVADELRNEMTLRTLLFSADIRLLILFILKQ